MSLDEWEYTPNIRVFEYTGSKKDGSKKAWNAAHNWVADTYYLSYDSQYLIDCTGEIGRCDYDISSWEIKTCHVDSGFYLLKQRQHKILQSVDGGYIFVLLREDESSPLWYVEDVIFRPAEVVDEYITGWHDNPSRFYSQTWVSADTVTP